MDDVAVVVGTYGDEATWTPLAERALASVATQTVPTTAIHVHDTTLARARNAGAAKTIGEWLVFLDADDELDPAYVERMLEGQGDLRQPMTLGVYPDGREDAAPVFIPPKRSFAEGNWLVVGTAVRRSLFDAVGGWGEEALYEDWALWWRCWNEGGKVGQAPGAIYRVSVNDTGRNRPDRARQIQWFNQISATLSPVSRSKGLM